MGRIASSDLGSVLPPACSRLVNHRMLPELARGVNGHKLGKGRKDISCLMITALECRD